jgi:HEAT repeat protein
VRELLTQLPPNEVHEIAEAIKKDGKLASEDKRRLLTALCAGASPSRRSAVKLVLADLGDEAMIREILGGWDQLEGDQQTYFAASLARQERIDTLRDVLARVKDPKTAAALTHLLAFAVQYQTTLDGIGSAMGARRRVAHPMQAEISVWLWNHAQACAVADTRRELLRAAAELGHIESRRVIRREIGSALHEGRLPDDLSLQILEGCGQGLELPELVRAASLRDAPNSSATAMRAIGRRGTSEALETLLQLQRGKLEPFAREALEETVEQLAAQLGISVERDPVGLLRAATT